jgi:outer membrane protein assembly factor BamD (BamD/ComL family)
MTLSRWHRAGVALAIMGLLAFDPAGLLAAPQKRVAGSGVGGNSPYATDAYPGFDGLDDLPKPEKKETSWFLHVSRDTPAEQFAYAQQMEAEGSLRAARRGYDALVREWPASPEAPKAQLALAMVWAKKYQDYDEAFEALEYLLDFYPRECDYLELVAYEYQLANLIVKEKKTFLGMSFTSTRVCRQHYESIVRRAPGAHYVPEAMLKIADLREQEDQYEEAVQVYSTLASKFPATPEAQLAAYLEAKARMWLCRRLAYNIPRCKDTASFLQMAIKRHPDPEQTEEMREWHSELLDYMAEDAYQKAKFYDSKQRTRHAALTAWERYLKEYPDSKHADDVRARIEVLQIKDQK